MQDQPLDSQQQPICKSCCTIYPTWSLPVTPTAASVALGITVHHTHVHAIMCQCKCYTWSAYTVASHWHIKHHLWHGLMCRVLAVTFINSAIYELPIWYDQLHPGFVYSNPDEPTAGQCYNDLQLLVTSILWLAVFLQALNTWSTVTVQLCLTKLYNIGKTGL